MTSLSLSLRAPAAPAARASSTVPQHRPLAAPALVGCVVSRSLPCSRKTSHLLRCQAGSDEEAGATLSRRAALAAAPALAMAMEGSSAQAAGIAAPPDVAAPPPDAEVSKTGVASKIIKAGDGSGKRPFAYDKVTVDYTGWTTDGKMFDSSVTRGKTATFPLRSVIKGWTEGLQLMETGETRRFWIPEAMAYRGQKGRPAGTLVFDVSLYGIERGPKPPEVPADVEAPPADAEVTASGLASKVLKPGTGKSPGPTSKVTVDYSGWTTDGTLFDSSKIRGKTASFRADYVIPGWTEGLQLMKEGETRRFWIPANLAYGACDGKTGGRPCGMLVFDVELFQTE